MNWRNKGKFCAESLTIVVDVLNDALRMGFIERNSDLISIYVDKLHPNIKILDYFSVGQLFRFQQLREHLRKPCLGSWGWLPEPHLGVEEAQTAGSLGECRILVGPA